MLKIRILTACVLIACLVPALFLLSATYWAYTMLSLSIVALFEWGHLIKLNTIALIVYLLSIAMIGIYAVQSIEQYGLHSFFYLSLSVFLLVSLFWLIIVPIWFKTKYIVTNKWLMGGLGFILVGSLWLALICAKASNPWLLLALLASIWISDSAAYFAGKAFGKNKLAPSFSPGKTWEGVGGALIGVTFFGIILYYGFNINNFALFPALWMMTMLGVIGDLFESMLKRQANIKDSGHILPGHGGLLDRIDGNIPSLPIGLLMIYIYNFYTLAV